MHACGILGNDTDEPRRRNGDADVENGLVETAGEAEARTIAKVVISCIK